MTKIIHLYKILDGKPYSVGQTEIHKDTLGGKLSIPESEIREGGSRNSVLVFEPKPEDPVDTDGYYYSEERIHGFEKCPCCGTIVEADKIDT